MTKGTNSVLAANLGTATVDQYIGLFLYCGGIQKEANVLVYSQHGTAYQGWCYLTVYGWLWS